MIEKPPYQLWTLAAAFSKEDVLVVSGGPFNDPLGQA